MFYKNLQISCDQILRYFLSNSLGFNQVRQLQLLQQQERSILNIASVINKNSLPSYDATVVAIWEFQDK